MARVVVRDFGWQRISRDLRALERHRAQVGVWGGESYPGGADIASVAAFAEYGTSRAPARSFMRYAADNGRDDLIRYTRGQLVALYVSGLSARGLLANVAGFHSAQQRAAIDSSPGWAVGNAPGTIARKGFDFPLVETGRLRGSLTYRVV